MARATLLLFAFLLAAGAMAQADGLDTAIGERLFRRHWVSAPASTKADDGLGPRFAATSCAACHPRGGAGSTLVIRFGKDEEGDPVYGRQLQPFGVPGLAPEAVPTVATAQDRPQVTLAALADGPLDPATRIGLRRPLPLGGLGALSRLSDDAILANEGVAGGRARRLADGRIGRFGWKASSATIGDQIAAAFSSDMGLSTTRLANPYGDCTPAQTSCRHARTGSEHGEPEIAEPIVAALEAFVDSLPAPAPPYDPEGERIFASLGCPSCHRPILTDGKGHSVALHSDVLLHAMGAALDDGIAEPGAASGQWRTAPLAGLGARLESGTGLLHDARAMTIEAALAAHGGDAAFSRQRFEAAGDKDRAALLTYLKGL